jgi:hypothetical protein
LTSICCAYEEFPIVSTMSRNINEKSVFVFMIVWESNSKLREILINNDVTLMEFVL